MGLTGETTFPCDSLLWRVPRQWLAVFAGREMSAQLRVLVEQQINARRHPAHFSSIVNVWRRDFLLTAETEYQEPANMPRNHAASQAAAQQRRRATSQAAVFATYQAKLTAEGYITRETASMLRWKVLLGQKENDSRVLISLQPPLAIGQMLTRLWSAGMRIDGFWWSTGFMCSIIRAPEQMVQVREMVQWLTGYCSVAPAIGLPPQPWHLTAAHGLVERIASYDSDSPAAN